ncbi:MAG: hypothetical protein QNI99_10050 [Woeseiaceae bacterium]|nr:hypothetical protein [Woeseiaceae bacterium]
MTARLFILSFIALAHLVAGCAGTETESRYLVPEEPEFRSFLVVGQAGDYNVRSEFERLVVSELRERGTSATAYHVAAGGDVAITRDSIREAVQQYGLEAVVLTRAISGDIDPQLRTGATDTVATRRDNGLLDLFRYDYEDLRSPNTLDLEISTTIVTEVYDVRAEALVWSGKSSTPPVESIAELVNGAAVSVADLIYDDGLIAD